jgi:hypothetical protein
MKKLTPEHLAKDWPCLDRTDEKRGVYWIRNALDVSYGYAPWAREILQFARDRIQALVDRAEAAGFHVVYAHTDSIVVPAEAEPLFANEVGSEIG